jgi:trans-aconitate 2-methyltransferase
VSTDWDPAQYELFAGPRLRPAIDLLGRIPPGERRHIVDLGCGGGQVTTLLAALYPEATIVGVDNSPAMLATAATAVPTARFVEAEFEHFEPEAPPDLVVSNAALHWVEGHTDLMLAWARRLTPGGVLAVQMPRNHAAPSHRAIQDTAADGPWAERVQSVRGIRAVATAADYAKALLPQVATVDTWETEYLHILTGPDAVFEWTRGTALLPYLAALGDEADGFAEAYRQRLRAAYPPLPDGRTLFPFRRVFVVAQAKV